MSHFFFLYKENEIKLIKKKNNQIIWSKNDSQNLYKIIK